MAECRRCGRPITWAASESTGRMMPIDPNPNPGGNVALIRPGERLNVVARVLGGELLAAAKANGTELHLTHFTTCPKREKAKAKAGKRRG